MNQTSALLATYGPAAGLTFPTDCREELDFSERLRKNPFLMAPMAGVTDASYRLMARAGGAALAYSEMVSVAGIHFGSDKTFELVDPDVAEGELAVQLFGSKPEQFAEAAAAVCERLGNKLALIDINMACPVPKVVRKGEGSALLDEPELAAEIVATTVKHASVPVTCKIRVGRRADKLVGVPFAQRMEAAGASAVAVHGRTAQQLYSGSSDDALVAKVAAAVSVPVIASGDIMTPERAVHAVRELGCDAAFVARGTYGNPWIFGDALRLLAGEAVPEHRYEQKLHALELHIRLMEATGAHMARARSLCGWYLRGIPDATTWRQRAMECATADEFAGLLGQLREQLREELPEQFA